MKIAIRDDDLNYFFKPEEIEENYKDIWNICPVSMSVIPFIKGDWPTYIMKLEKIGPGKNYNILLNNIKSNKKIYPIGDNLILINYIKSKIKEKKIYLTIHGIYHLNEDPITPILNNNFGIGAEFYTTRDLTEKLKEAKDYLESIFNQKIEIFIPPQNIVNKNGLNAIINNNLSICGDLPKWNSIYTIKLFGIYNYTKYLLFKLANRKKEYPYTIINNNFKIVGHYRLQPKTDIDILYKEFDRIYSKDWVFVISTHSYAFNYKIIKTGFTIKETLKRFLEYAKNKGNIEFVNLKQIFDL